MKCQMEMKPNEIIQNKMKRNGNKMNRNKKKQNLLVQGGRFYSGKSGKSKKTKQEIGDNIKVPETKTSQTTEVDTRKYKADQLYTYNEWSFYDIENDMAKHRIKQPSSLPQAK
ncbi:hypothetical protein FSP39_019027 [Pinctada imbricata]|uniref:NADH dehydrogenase [ubiquinone] flavoprotein 3, mitochondrial n=1 Tax=Pinctada imbricata TaxID=66713 RepID=A0AA89C0G8_PINIB|nr:hypothetical protein FSP39_019027 [Pinctada imbricata]